MAFIVIDRDAQAATYAGDLVTIVNTLNTLHAMLERTNERMTNMDTTQIGELYGLNGNVTAVKNAISSAFGVIDTNTSIEAIRTQLG